MVFLLLFKLYNWIPFFFHSFLSVSATVSAGPPWLAMAWRKFWQSSCNLSKLSAWFNWLPNSSIIFWYVGSLFVLSVMILSENSWPAIIPREFLVALSMSANLLLSTALRPLLMLSTFVAGVAPPSPLFSLTSCISRPSFFSAWQS